jgi:hypothetical protein
MTVPSATYPSDLPPIRPTLSTVQDFSSLSPSHHSSGVCLEVVIVRARQSALLSHKVLEARLADLGGAAIPNPPNML